MSRANKWLTPDWRSYADDRARRVEEARGARERQPADRPGGRPRRRTGVLDERPHRQAPPRGRLDARRRDAGAAVPRRPPAPRPRAAVPARPVPPAARRVACAARLRRPVGRLRLDDVLPGGRPAARRRRPPRRVHGAPAAAGPRVGTHPPPALAGGARRCRAGRRWARAGARRRGEGPPRPARPPVRVGRRGRQRVLLGGHRPAPGRAAGDARRCRHGDRRCDRGAARPPRGAAARHARRPRRRAGRAPVVGGAGAVRRHGADGSLLRHQRDLGADARRARRILRRPGRGALRRAARLVPARRGAAAGSAARRGLRRRGCHAGAAGLRDGRARRGCGAAREDRGVEGRRRVGGDRVRGH